MRSQDTQAERITFGVELETTIPAMSGIAVGGYHSGATVRVGADVLTSVWEKMGCFSDFGNGELSDR